MAIGIDEGFTNEIDDDVIDNGTNQLSDIDSEPLSDNVDYNDSPQGDDAVLDSLLESRGIEDKSKIKFENEDGNIEEVDWNNLSGQDKLNILQSSEYFPEEGLEDSEIQLINAIRGSGMTPSEFLQYTGASAIQNFAQNNFEPQFEVNQYSDDELYLMDLMSRTGNLTEDEALESLQRAKANEDLYLKQIDAIRMEYVQAEQENRAQEEIEEEQRQQYEYLQFSDQIVDEINDLNSILGFDLNMDSDDMQELYDFITGSDAAGNNYMAKALADPQILVKTAWLTLNGDQMVSDITNYFQREIANVRRESYQRGVEDAQNKMNNNIVFRSNSKSHQIALDDGLDDF